MLKLTNICDDPWTMDQFGREAGALEGFLRRTGLDGFELIKWGGDEAKTPAISPVVGRHLHFWPTWLDFWRGGRDALLRQFGSEEDWTAYYRAATPDEFIGQRRAELLDADRSGARYAVCHVSHVELEHCYTGRYTYENREIIATFAEMINAVLDGLTVSIPLLFENHWYPGLTLLEPAEAGELLERVRYANTGFALDVGHMMNTNSGLRTESEAAEYLMRRLDGLGSLCGYIRTMHLNSSLTGEQADRMKQHRYNPAEPFQTRLLTAMEHVGQIDRHVPFLDPAIQRVVEKANPEFLVYELASDSLDDLEKKIQAQSRALGL